MPSTACVSSLPPAALSDAHAPVGVLGGMGPLATVDFMHKLLAATSARCDQEHLPLLISSIPQVPDRTAAYRGEGASPPPALIASGRRLVDGGAALLVMPCNTAHLWFEARCRPRWGCRLSSPIDTSYPQLNGRSDEHLRLP